ncbi:type 1 periplasmic binding fold superfamily protein [Flavobacterium luteum]|uniref:Type 1 periplasmic binding fold superfamily protein n=1 Tax=Flavobacterium luteum TaxID=2026654 RepID=A0A7J5AEX7_9FLAO|nr:type 1 periplasmic binding fold superfamily protein [Flavobacterium luteum]KAB1156134.1 type 1 periplasmic binding fold superfamily protein [Flavobacterium luteum]
MKNSKILLITLLILLTLSSCSSPYDTEPIVENEVITTISLVYTPEGGGTTITLESKDLDGDGPKAPIVNVSGKFAQGKTYTGVLTFLNETVNPPVDITKEIKELALEHQIFYQRAGTINSISYADTASNFDSSGKPIGLESVFTTTRAASGSIKIILKHEPNKSGANVAFGDITNAGGSTDAEVVFNIVVE